MTRIESATAALALSAAGLAAVPAGAAGVAPNGGVNQHATVMSNIGQAQRRDASAISRVQNNIRNQQQQQQR